MNITDYFESTNIKHVRAYNHLNNTGEWPKDFIPKDIEFNKGWQIILAGKLADAWVKFFINWNDFIDFVSN